MKRPTRDECLQLLAAQADPAVPPFAWRIGGVPHTREDALELAELCLLTGQDMLLVNPVSASLALARRLADLEERVGRRRTARRVLPQSGVAQPSDGSWL